MNSQELEAKKRLNTIELARIVANDKEVRFLLEEKNMSPTAIHDRIYGTTEGLPTDRKVRSKGARNLAKLWKYDRKSYYDLIAEYPNPE